MEHVRTRAEPPRYRAAVSFVLRGVAYEAGDLVSLKPEEAFGFLSSGQVEHEPATEVIADGNPGSN